MGVRATATFSGAPARTPSPATAPLAPDIRGSVDITDTVSLGEPRPELPEASLAAALIEQRVSAAATQETRTRRELIDKMLARGGGRRLEGALRGDVQASLATVPVPVLRTLSRAGVAITVVRPGETPLDAGVVQPRRADADYPAATLRRHVDDAVADADRRYGEPLSQARAALEAHQQAADAGAVSAATDLRARQLADALRKVEKHHRIHAAHAMVGLTNGRVRPLQVALPKGVAWTPVTVREIARLHGAVTDEEEARFCDLMAAINGDRLAAAQDALGQGQDNAPADRPFRSDAALIAAPDLYFHRRDPDPSKPAVILDGHDHRSMRGWDKGVVYGQFFANAARPTVVLRTDQLGENEYGHLTPVHEAGHAYEWAVERLDSDGFAAFESARDDTWVRLLVADSDRFPSVYARVNPREMVAESFAEAFGTRPSRLTDLDPAWADTFQAFLARADHLGAERPSRALGWLVCGGTSRVRD